MTDVFLYMYVGLNTSDPPFSPLPPHHKKQAWHAWAKANAHLAERALLAAAAAQKQQQKQQQHKQEEEEEEEEERTDACLVQAVGGYLQTIALGMSSPSPSSRNRRATSSSSSAAVVLQDTLRLLTLWFAHGARPAVHRAVEEGPCGLLF